MGSGTVFNKAEGNLCATKDFYHGLAGTTSHATIAAFGKNN